MTKMPHGMSRLDLFLKECLNHHALNDDRPLPDTFGYLLAANPVTGNLSHAHIVNAFDDLVESMRVNKVKPGTADAGMTFLGQFIDHDITLDATSAIGTKIDPRSIRNIRTPNLDLDCVYGDGPEASPYLYGQGDAHEFLLFGREDNPYDLARNCKGRALIGDFRNDENILVSQVQGAFVALHNILMTQAKENGDAGHDIANCAAMGIRSDVWHDSINPGLRTFEEVRRFIRLHYQWIVLNEFLPAFVDQHDIDHALSHDIFPHGPMMPAEFSVAAYRFGHATVQHEYTLRHGEAPLDLFALRGFGPRDPGATVEMAQFFGPNAQKALPVGTDMANTLFELPDFIVGSGLTWGDHQIPLPQAKKLALRNILRDRTAMQLPSGQQMARHLGIPELTAPKELRDKHITKTPLWFYCLQEAQESGKGKLTGVGGKIVASVFARILKEDYESVLHVPGFTPWSGFGDTCSMANIMAFVEKHRDDVKYREDLFCG
ncbi:Animal haem peroxidase [Cognatiyoonia koreensis]|uniref:Animal haem peroxidase n=1 Tax=Cognatiyoonia koreensis TaxID=364200 RepID=A0A1I0NZS5_9RHOB|nr:peroxidase family protein [Cognatiyoonia koreensis]SEW07366.1 Animal haem peroxidase [Cognatiyoonia koreensis]